VGARFGEFFDSLGKALAVVAGLAIVVYIIGGLSMYARLQRQGLLAEAVVPEIPRERLAVLGLTQLLVTIILGLLLVWAARRLPARGAGELWSEWWPRVRGSKAFLVAAVVVVAAALLITPVSWNGALSAVLVLGALCWFLAWGRRVDPLLLFLVALGVAVAFTVLRQLEFPTQLSPGTVILTEKGAERVPEAVNGEIDARVIAFTDDEVLLGYESPEQIAREDVTGQQEDLVLLRIPRKSVATIAYDLPKDPVSFSESLPETLFGYPKLKCLPPTCQWGHDEQDRAIAVPFVF
jgi:hypothetical protein